MNRPSARPTQSAAHWAGIAGGLLVLAAFLVPAATSIRPAAAATSTSVSGTVATGIFLPKGSGNVPDPHGPYNSFTTDSCAACHRAHTSQGRMLSVKVSPQSTLCFTCHGAGAGANTDVQSEYAGIPANVPSAGQYYSHNVTAPTTHTLRTDDEFTGVLNRHSECSDCHDPHQIGTGSSTSSPDGTPWTPGGTLLGASGVSVVNGAANAAPTYTFLNGQGTSKITAEYQLCFKCHSGSTILLGNPQAGAVPYPYSLDNLDKGKELNPANASFHPIEAAGTNQTDAMKNSLTGSSTYRIFTFPTEISSGVAPTMRTVRCTNCHTSGSIGASGTTFGGSQPTHASANRGLLIAQYVDRTLLKTGVAYNSGNFALCFGCHAEAAFNSGFTSSDTNFSPHFKHVAGISGSGGGGLSIDTPGDGQGNALCAECHFRLHSTTFAVGTPSYSRLVNFAPDVLPFKGKLEWTSTSVGHGTCTLTCHGHDHDAQGY